MKEIWKRVKGIWWDFWDINEKKGAEEYLSASDKHWLLYWNFLTCMVMLAFVLLILGINNVWVRHHNNREVDEMINTIAVYMASATEDEYDEIAKTIRHDLVFSEYGEDVEKYVQYIPNTTDNCRTCMESYPALAYLVSINTGELYSLDLFEKGADPDEDSGGTIFNSGYDEISEAYLHVTKRRGESEGIAEIERGRGIVSAHRMKALFCDDCIREILHTVEQQLTVEFVIFDAEKKTFYPINDGTMVQIGDYFLKIRYKNRDYEITIEYVSE